MPRLDYLRKLEVARQQSELPSKTSDFVQHTIVPEQLPNESPTKTEPSLLPSSFPEQKTASHTKDPAPHPEIERSESLETIKYKIHEKVLARIDLAYFDALPVDQRRPFLSHLIEKCLSEDPSVFSYSQRSQLVNDLIDEILGFGPLERILQDHTINDILVNGAKQVYIEKRGKLERCPIQFRDDDHLLEIIRRIVSRVGRRVDESSPMVDARLQDGSRVNAIIPPLALTGPMLSIRRFGAHRLTMKDLLDYKSLSSEMATFLQAAVQAKLNILVSGGTGTGKTTLLNALSSYIPSNERIITIEDAAELHLLQEHVGQLESRPANIEGKGEVKIRDLLRNALRMRPNRIIIGECRGAEALDMLQAMNTGHEGSMSTLHANTPRDALSRLEMMILMSGLDLPLRVIRQQIASSVHLIVQVSRLPGGSRNLTSITEVLGMEQEMITTQEIFAFRQTSIDLAGKAIGRFESCNIRPRCEARIQASGITLPNEIFTSNHLE